MTLDITAIRARATAATAGPWKWRENEFLDRYMVQTRTGKRRARPGKNARDSWVFLLTGKMHGDPNKVPEVEIARRAVDEFDFHHVLALRWSTVRGNHVWNSGPSDADANFIAAARTDVPALCDEIEALRARVEAAERRIIMLRLGLIQIGALGDVRSDEASGIALRALESDGPIAAESKS